MWHYFYTAVWRCHCFVPSEMLYWPRWSVMIQTNIVIFWHFAVLNTPWWKTHKSQTLWGKYNLWQLVLLVAENFFAHSIYCQGQSQFFPLFFVQLWNYTLSVSTMQFCRFSSWVCSQCSDGTPPLAPGAHPNWTLSND